MIGLQIFAGVARAEAEKMVRDYWIDLYGSFGIDIRSKKSPEAKPANDEDAFAIPGSHQSKKS